MRIILACELQAITLLWEFTVTEYQVRINGVNELLYPVRDVGIAIDVMGDRGEGVIWAENYSVYPCEPYVYVLTAADRKRLAEAPARKAKNDASDAFLEKDAKRSLARSTRSTSKKILLLQLSVNDDHHDYSSITTTLSAHVTQAEADKALAVEDTWQRASRAGTHYTEDWYLTIVPVMTGLL